MISTFLSLVLQDGANLSCWTMLQAAEHSPRYPQTLSRLPHVFIVNLPSSVKSIEHSDEFANLGVF